MKRRRVRGLNLDDLDLHLAAVVARQDPGFEQYLRSLPDGDPYTDPPWPQVVPAEAFAALSAAYLAWPGRVAWEQHRRDCLKSHDERTPLPSRAAVYGPPTLKD